MVLPVLFFLLMGCFVSWTVIFALLASGFAQGNTATPQHHHTHVGVVPRIGGVGLIFGFSIVYLLSFFLMDRGDNQSLMHYGVFIGAVLAFLLGFIDDMRPLGAKLKMLVQVCLGALAYGCGLGIERFGIPFTDVVINLNWLGLFVTIFWFVSVMNLINLIDGLDGLAGGVGLMLMVLLTYLSFENGRTISLILSLGMVGAIVGFLFHNFPPAKVYMGDSGAYMIGYVIAAVSLLNAEKGAVAAALIAPVLALSLPIVDVAYAMIRRGLKGLPLFRPDKNHIHHKLIRSGLSHRKTVLVLYSISLVALFGALLVFASSGRLLPIILGFAFAIILFVLRGQKISAASLKAMLSESMQGRQDIRNALYLKDWFIAESERADTGQHLWMDYQFVLKKMGFCRAELKVGSELRMFFVPGTMHEDESYLCSGEFKIGSEIPVVLSLYVESDNFTSKQFALLADIALEAWNNASSRWKDVNGSELSFDSKAKEATNYREQKNRNLYRPAL